MSNYELYEHKKSDTVKWVLTLIAFIVVGVLIAGLIAGWFDKGEDSLPVQDETATIQDGGLNFLNVSLEELKMFARITGHADLHELSVEDLCTISREISEFTDIPHA